MQNINTLGFVRVAAAIPAVKVGDCKHNAEHIVAQAKTASNQNASLIVFPELSITGYTCADLFGQPFLLQSAADGVRDVVKASGKIDSIVIVGAPIAFNNSVYNCAIVIYGGKIKGIVPKTHLPNYNEFYEARWFASGEELKGRVDTIDFCSETVPFGPDLLFRFGETYFGIEICEDLWVPIPPSSHQALGGANLLINISATDEVVGKHDYLRSLISQQSARTMSAYVYSSCGFGESTTDLVFAGNAMIAENGTFLAESERFSFDEQVVFADIDIGKLMTLRRRTTTFRNDANAPEFRTIDIDSAVVLDEIRREFDSMPFIPNDAINRDERCREIFNIQVNGLAQRFIASRSQTAIIGISGGLDSTLALLVAARTMDKLGLSRKQVVGITMPGFGTTGRTYNNAINLMKALGISIKEISIKDACIQHFKDIGLADCDRSVTYENSQARERTQILMDVANQLNGIVVGTGDLSELALGWATYNGDHMSMYGVNCSIPKTLVRYLVSWVAADGNDPDAKPYLLDIVDTPISPELLPADENGNIAQKTEDLVGPYELHDFLLYNFVRFGFAPRKLYYMAVRAFAGKYDALTVKKWLTVFLRRFFNQQFKRSALPDGPKVGSISLSPRGDWRMPSDATVRMWLDEAEQL